ncbi:chaplin family protein [Streptomyces sp. ODS05-4]|uniref:chaplin family protein n=1 Tax=Streptomyces sp. ODS05-4 TaxID=2944939 RepID=UPI00210AFD37|nr:chaplin family protein [Streptomyces sp. ODS05-4]
MTSRRFLTTLGVTAAVLGAGLGGAAPATAGGLGDFLSPAFGTSCANLDNGAHADGVTRRATGTVGGNVAGLPLSNPANQCGGADQVVEGFADAMLPVVSR